MNIDKLQDDNSTDAEWMPIGDQTCEVLVRPMTHPAARKKVAWIRRKHGRAMDAGLINGKLERAVFADAMATTVVRDWRGFTSGTGKAEKEVPFSVDACRDLLSKYGSLLTDVIHAATVVGDRMLLDDDSDGDALGKD